MKKLINKFLDALYSIDDLDDILIHVSIISFILNIVIVASTGNEFSSISVVLGLITIGSVLLNTAIYGFSDRKIKYMNFSDMPKWERFVFVLYGMLVLALFVVMIATAFI